MTADLNYSVAEKQELVEIIEDLKRELDETDNNIAALKIKITCKLSERQEIKL